MGTSRNSTQLVGKLRNTERAMTSRAPLMAATDSVKRTLEVSAGRAGIRRGSPIAGRPWRGVYVRRAGQGMAVGYSKPAKLVNSRTRPHVIGARGLGTRTQIAKRVGGASLVSTLSGQSVSASFNGRKGAKALRFGNGDFAAYARHKGTRGKHFFEAAKPVAARDGARAARTMFANEVVGVFR